jgi:hypothetical protein
MSARYTLITFAGLASGAAEIGAVLDTACGAGQFRVFGNLVRFCRRLDFVCVRA